MQLLVAFAQQQDFCTGRDVIPTNRLWIISDVAIGFVGKVSKILFTGLSLCKTSALRNLQPGVKFKV
jgi:hypothetical protein